MRKEQPFTEDELRVFEEYCYTVMGLHKVADIVNQHSFYDGDRIVSQVRQSLATIYQLKHITDEVERLLAHAKPDGSIEQSEKTQQSIQLLQQLMSFKNKGGI